MPVLTHAHAKADSKMIDSYEQQLIKRCAHVSPSPGGNGSIESIIKRELNWPSVVDLSEEQGVAPLLYYSLNFHKNQVPQTIFSELRESYQKTQESNHLLYSELKQILTCFGENKVESLLLKGIDLAIRVYPNVGLRPMADIDLLIKKDDLSKIEKSLFSLNYLMHPGYRKVLDKPAGPYLNTVVCKKLTQPHVSLHLHWHILNHSFFPCYCHCPDTQRSSKRLRSLRYR